MAIKERHPPSQLERAIALAVEAHAGHRGREGQPYILHPLGVMARVETDAERIVAILHDTVESEGDRVSYARLRQEGFPEEIVQAIDCLTRRDGEPYADMIERIAPNPLARRVKLADLADNLDLLRQAELTQADFEGLQMRLRAWHRLKNAASDDTSARSASGSTS
jgi:(p)ppGpp synthase/HD superfamily hydrolase